MEKEKGTLWMKEKGKKGSEEGKEKKIKKKGNGEVLKERKEREIERER